MGIEGEKLVNYYTFYAVFKTPEEYRIVIENKTLGTLPVDSPMIIGQHMIFAGKRWKIIEINSDKKVIYVKSSKGGNPPKFSGNGINIHTKIRQEMLNIYLQRDYKISMGNTEIDFLDDISKELFEEGLETFQDNKLDEELILQQGNDVYILPWMGDVIVNTLVALLIKGDFKASNFAGVIEVEKTQVNIVKEYIKKLVSNKTLSNAKLAQLIEDKIIDKFDHYLPDSLLIIGYGEKMFDIESTMKWIQKSFNFKEKTS